jgi:hypothetical protein
MNKQFIYLAGILAVAMTATFAVTAQETDANANNTTLNDSVINIGEASHIAQNLSTVNNQTIVVAPISELAGVAPMVAAGASSAQVASEPAGSFKIGTGVGGPDLFNPKHVVIKTAKLGIPIKAMRDTGKMFFVCDLV